MVLLDAIESIDLESPVRFDKLQPDSSVGNKHAVALLLDIDWIGVRFEKLGGTLDGNWLGHAHRQIVVLRLGHDVS